MQPQQEEAVGRLILLGKRGNPWALRGYVIQTAELTTNVCLRKVQLGLTFFDICRTGQTIHNTLCVFPVIGTQGNSRDYHVLVS